ncbi:MAG TPA: PepSY domain-containing protein, partial [Caulobacter sp.]|nr:PepSY domain-containing protein [Caulobacter sp.]
RVWWRDLHAVTGAFACAILLFLAVTGMPWSGYWGENFRRLVNDSGLGMPAGLKATTVASDAALAATRAGSWTMDRAAVPTVPAATLRPLPIAAIMAEASRRGVAPGYVVRLPGSAGGVYTIQSYPRQATGQRVIHLDQYTGRVIADLGFRDYGPVSKAVEWGIAVHTGGQFGRVNQLVMLAGCLAIVTLSISAAVMWWRRRPAGRLAAPPAQPRGLSAFALFALAIGLVLPLLGLSILLAFAVDGLASNTLKLKHGL